jgi:hypothetical protein
VTDTELVANTRPAPAQYARGLGGGKALAPLDPALRVLTSRV